jgi:hypothetical protein
MSFPEPSQSSYPNTYRAFKTLAAYSPTLYEDWFTVIFALVERAQQQCAQDRIPLLPIPVELIDALALTREEWDKTVPKIGVAGQLSNPKNAAEFIGGVFGIGLGRMKMHDGADYRNAWVTRLERAFSDGGYTFLKSVGGSALVELMGEIGNRR